MEGENVFFHFHIDKNSKENFDCLKKLKNASFAANRYCTSWASPDLVYATYESIKEIVGLHPSGYVVLMSESDYPVKTIEYIKKYLQAQGKNFIVTNKIPCYNPIENSNNFWIEGGLRRCNCYTLFLKSRQIATIEPKVINWGNFRQFGKVLIKKPSRIFAAFDLWFKERRLVPEGLEYYGGDQWFILKLQTLKLMVNYINENPSLLDDMQFTDTPDEVFFQTLAGSLIDEKERESTTLRYIYWPEIPSNSPNNFSLSDKDLIHKAIVNSNILFIRKVQDEIVADYIDKQLDNNN